MKALTEPEKSMVAACRGLEQEVRPADYPKTGERWICKVTGRTARIMADDIEGYVVARFKGAMPWIMHRNDWHSKYKRA